MNNNIYNSSIVFRCPNDLKEKMRLFAEGKGQALSSFIRTACVEVMKREATTTPPLKEQTL